MRCKLIILLFVGSIIITKMFLDVSIPFQYPNFLHFMQSLFMTHF